MVERQLPKLNVAGSNPVARSTAWRKVFLYLVVPVLATYLLGNILCRIMDQQAGLGTFNPSFERSINGSLQVLGILWVYAAPVIAFCLLNRWTKNSALFLLLAPLLSVATLFGLFSILSAINFHFNPDANFGIYESMWFFESRWQVFPYSDKEFGDNLAAWILFTSCIPIAIVWVVALYKTKPNITFAAGLVPASLLSALSLIVGITPDEPQNYEYEFVRIERSNGPPMEACILLRDGRDLLVIAKNGAFRVHDHTVVSLKPLGIEAIRDSGIQVYDRTYGERPRTL